MPLPPHRPQRVGHRGIPAERTENTLASFLLALDNGADAIELDAHVTRDGVAVVHHDEAVAGHTIAESSWSLLANLPLPGAVAAGIPKLSDVLDAVGARATVYIELKGAAIEEAVLRIAKKHAQEYAVHSFDHDAVERAAKCDPHVPRGFLLDKGTATPVLAMQRAAKRLGARDVWPHWSLVDGEFVDAARALQLRAIVWTVNSKDLARKLTTLGVSGICTDDVRILEGL